MDNLYGVPMVKSTSKDTRDQWTGHSSCILERNSKRTHAREFYICHLCITFRENNTTRCPSRYAATIGIIWWYFPRVETITSNKWSRSSHSILLKEGTKPINVRPYRYTYIQKAQIKKKKKKKVHDMLKLGLIRSSISQFSSSIL